VRVKEKQKKQERRSKKCNKTPFLKAGRARDRRNVKKDPTDGSSVKKRTRKTKKKKREGKLTKALHGKGGKKETEVNGNSTKKKTREK